ncbi:dTMP kinase [Gammaproteobacteria bacterium]|nr:dTMP kinase [Gammaproteobacteria bacterium]
MNNQRGKFISFEGGDGVGKTTQINLARQYVEKLGHTPVVTREPGGTMLSEQIRGLVLESSAGITPVTEVLMMFAARAQHTSEVIEPNLAAGKWVLCDRFTDASYAYQGGGRGLPDELIDVLAEIATNGLEPDLTLLLDLDVEEGVRRSHLRDSPLDRFESEAIEFKNRIRAAYLKRQDHNSMRIVLVDAAQSIQEIEFEIATRIDDLHARSLG